MNTCNVCQFALKPNHIFCGNCGNKIEDVRRVTSPSLGSYDFKPGFSSVNENMEAPMERRDSSSNLRKWKLKAQETDPSLDRKGSYKDLVSEREAQQRLKEKELNEKEKQEQKEEQKKKIERGGSTIWSRPKESLTPSSPSDTNQRPAPPIPGSAGSSSTSHIAVAPPANAINRAMSPGPVRPKSPSVPIRPKSPLVPNRPKSPSNRPAPPIPRPVSPGNRPAPTIPIPVPTVPTPPVPRGPSPRMSPSPVASPPLTPRPTNAIKQTFSPGSSPRAPSRPQPEIPRNSPTPQISTPTSTPPAAPAASAEKPERGDRNTNKIEEEYVKNKETSKQLEEYRERKRIQSFMSKNVDPATCHCQMRVIRVDTKKKDNSDYLFAVYVIEVEFHESAWTLFRRFSQIKAIDFLLRREIKGYSHPLPSVRASDYGKNGKLDPTFLNLRLEGLKTYFETTKNFRMDIFSRKRLSVPFIRFIAPLQYGDLKPTGFVMPFKLEV
eukprot:TRINITY_DN870_c0_g1_i1.p1 TRINITY_DN870_c0_g1~~TRINITY_DN870_c0_g1_i1.p1  ORF type:complete len:494 (-),score=144.45 TRINITY_DN870_c0_g1_i1:65-1546(-)